MAYHSLTNTNVRLMHPDASARTERKQKPARELKAPLILLCRAQGGWSAAGTKGHGKAGQGHSLCLNLSFSSQHQAKDVGYLAQHQLFDQVGLSPLPGGRSRRAAGEPRWRLPALGLCLLQPSDWKMSVSFSTSLPLKSISPFFFF